MASSKKKKKSSISRGYLKTVEDMKKMSEGRNTLKVFTRRMCNWINDKKMLSVPSGTKLLNMNLKPIYKTHRVLVKPILQELKPYRGCFWTYFSTLVGWFEGFFPTDANTV